MLFSGIIQDHQQLKALGWLIILFVSSMIIFNMIVILYDIFAFARLLCMRYKYRMSKKHNKRVYACWASFYRRCFANLVKSKTKNTQTAKQNGENKKLESVRDN